jgi:CBS-domain-containing membrane protein
MAAMMKGRPLHEITVGGTMARRVSSCKAGDSVEAVSRVMSDRQVRRVPVVDDENRPIGVVSLSDLARQATIAPRKDGTFRELAQTLAAISRRGPKATAKHPRQDAPNTAGHTIPTVVREDTPAS